VPTPRDDVEHGSCSHGLWSSTKLIRHIPITDPILSKTYHAVYVRHIRRCRTHRPLCGSNGTIAISAVYVANRPPTTFLVRHRGAEFLGIHVCEHCSKIKTTQFWSRARWWWRRTLLRPHRGGRDIWMHRLFPSFVQKIIHSWVSPTPPEMWGLIPPFARFSSHTIPQERLFC
jgi:hypothetical protein